MTSVHARLIVLAASLCITGCGSCGEEPIPGAGDPGTMVLDDLPNEGRDALEQPDDSATLNNGLGATEPAQANLGEVADLALSTRQTCALLASGQVWCWGGGGLADSAPTQEMLEFDAASVAMSDDTNLCILGTAGEVSCRGPGLTGSWMGARQVANITALSSSASRVCALSGTGKAQCFGAREDTLDVPGIDAMANTDEVLCVLADGRVTCTGDNSAGGLGVDPTEMASGTREIELPGDALSLIKTPPDPVLRYPGSFCALVDGTPWCWPRPAPDDFLGTYEAEPGPLGGRDDLVALDGGCALSMTGDVACGLPVRLRAMPTPAVSELWGRGDKGACWVRMADGVLECAGTNSWGELGDGSIVPVRSE